MIDPTRQHEVSPRRELLRLLDALADFWQDFDVPASDGYGTLTASSRSALRLKHALIAEHALSLSLPVITRDAGFSRFDALEITLI